MSDEPTLIARRVATGHATFAMPETAIGREPKRTHTVPRRDQSSRAERRPVTVSRVSDTDSTRMAGAANSTIGSISPQAMSQDRIQCEVNRPSAKNGILAMPDAMAEVRPD